MLYQPVQNPIFPNQKTGHNWGQIDHCLKDENEIEYYKDFLDSNLESMESDSEYYSENDEFQDFPDLDSTNPTISIVEVDFNSDVESDSEYRENDEFQDFQELNTRNSIISILEPVDSDLEFESDSDVEIRNHEKIPSSMTIIELDSDSEHEILDRNPPLISTSIPYTNILESESDFEHESEFQSNIKTFTSLKRDSNSDMESDFESVESSDQEIEVCFDEENSKNLMTVVNSTEDFETIKINIEFHGHNFREEDLNIKLENENNLIVELQDANEKFERNFILPNHCKLDKIKSKFNIWHKGGETVQTLGIRIPKETVLKIPITKSTSLPVTVEE